VTFDPPRTDAGRPGTPLPALGLVLGVALLILGMGWSLADPSVAADAQRPVNLLESAINVVLVVAPPLLITRIPALLRRQAAPFLILGGVLFVAFTIIPNFYMLGSVSALMAFAMGWMRLRGRPPLTLFLALGVPVLLLVSLPLYQAVLPHVVLTNAPTSVGSRLGWFVGFSLFTSLPVCVPVLLSGIPLFHSSSVQTTPDASSATPVDRSADWNVFAVASLVFSLVLGAPWAIVLGHIAHSQIRRTHEKGPGLATGGLVLGYGSIVAVGLLIWFIYEAFKNWTYTF
jgi:hypothetical protein